MLSLSDLFTAHPALSVCADDIRQARDCLIDTFRSGHKLLLCGNGGSAADCDHICGELQKAFLLPRPLTEADRTSLAAVLGSHHPDFALLSSVLQGGLPAVSLTAHTAALTAFANDATPDAVFAQSVMALGQRGDLLLCLSTSGFSRNVVLAAETALARGLSVVSLTGERPSRLSELSHVTVRVPATETYRVQEYHLPVYHYLCASAEEALFGDSAREREV